MVDSEETEINTDRVKSNVNQFKSIYIERMKPIARRNESDSMEININCVLNEMKIEKKTT